MNRSAIRATCLAAVTALSACGETPPGDFPLAGDPGPSPNLQQVSFTGVADPATGRLQIFMGPQATMVRIPESADNNVNTVAVNTVQVYGGTVSFTSSNVLYPAGCNPQAPMAMLANVEVLSGFTEQLRNVYANMSAQSSGPSFCATNAIRASFVGTIGTTVGAYLYQPLNPVSSTQSALRRTMQWALTLPDTLTPYWFTGDVWAEIIPMPPANPLPADNASYHRATAGNVAVTFTWTDDPLANGANPEGYVVARPSRGRASLTILRCGSSALPFNPADCTTTTLPPTRFTGGTTTQNLATGTTGYWYQWSLRSAFRLPGAAAWTLGSTVITRHLSVATP